MFDVTILMFVAGFAVGVWAEAEYKFLTKVKAKKDVKK